jgi:hypothetical protein
VLLKCLLALLLLPFFAKSCRATLSALTTAVEAAGSNWGACRPAAEQSRERRKTKGRGVVVCGEACGISKLYMYVPKRHLKQPKGGRLDGLVRHNNRGVESNGNAEDRHKCKRFGRAMGRGMFPRLPLVALPARCVAAPSLQRVCARGCLAAASPPKLTQKRRRYGSSSLSWYERATRTWHGMGT